MRRIKLYTARAYHKTTGRIDTFRWSVGGYASWPSDTPASTTWWPVVRRPADLVVQIPAPGDTATTRAAEGRLVLSNTVDRQRDARPLNTLVTDYVTEGWDIRVEEVFSGQPYRSAVTVFLGIMGRAEIARGEVTIPVKDRSADFDVALLSEKYAGTGGVEGPADLKDKLKERVFGFTPYMEPTYLGYDAATGLHQLSVNGGHAIEAVEAFGDSGAGRAYTAGTPTGDQWTYNAATGMIYCSGAARPQAPWARVRGDKTGGIYRRLIGELMSFWIRELTGVRAAADIDAGSVAAIDATPRIIGLVCGVGEQITIRDALNRAAASIWGGYWTEGALGKFRVGRVPPIGGAVAASYRAGVSCDPIVPQSTSTTAPAKRVTFRFARNTAVIDQPAPAASADEATRAKAEWLEETTADNPTVIAAYGNAAATPVFETLLSSRADAAAEAALAATDLAEPARTWRITAWDGAPGLDLTAEVVGIDDIPGFTGAGGRAIVIGRDLHRRGAKAALICIN